MTCCHTNLEWTNQPNIHWQCIAIVFCKNDDENVCLQQPQHYTVWWLRWNTSSTLKKGADHCLMQQKLSASNQNLYIWSDFAASIKQPSEVLGVKVLLFLCLIALLDFVVMLLSPEMMAKATQIKQKINNNKTGFIFENCMTLLLLLFLCVMLQCTE